jgi:hypothetical protein
MTPEPQALATAAETEGASSEAPPPAPTLRPCSGQVDFDDLLWDFDLLLDDYEGEESQ